MKKIITMAILLILVTGCGDKKVDSSTDEKFKSSIESVKNSLTEDKRKEFEDAVQVIAFSEIGNLFEAAADPDGVQRKIKNKLNGKTADEIIAESNQILAERKKNEREQAINEIEEIKAKIAEIENKKLEMEKTREDLKKFNVVRSRFYFRKNSFMEEAVIELTVKNETTYPVSRAYFNGILSSPDRSIPWVQDSFNYKISGGLEPGEQVTWKLSPNTFGEWSKAPKDRDDMVLTVSVYRIDGADEEAIYNYNFSEKDNAHIEKLNKRLSELQKSFQS